MYSLQAYNNAGGGSKWSESPYEVSVDAVSEDATNNGATTGVGGIVGNAWYFDGVNDFVDDIRYIFQQADQYPFGLILQTMTVQ